MVKIEDGEIINPEPNCLKRNMTDTEIKKKLAGFLGFKYLGDNLIWNPLEDMSDAWELFEKLPHPKKLTNYFNSTPMKLGPEVFVCYCVAHPNRDVYPYGHKYSSGIQKSAPRAICMAMLKVIDGNN